MRTLTLAELALHPDAEKLAVNAPTYVLATVILLWCFALICIPFFLWGIYSQAHKQTKLLRGVIDELRKRKP